MTFRRHVAGRSLPLPFCRAVAGVGYTLLRLAAPESLPCLLLLD